MKRYKLYCEDAYTKLLKMKSKSVDCILTDPPYDLKRNEKGNSGGSVNNIKKMYVSHDEIVECNIGMGYDIEKYGEQFLRICKLPNIYVFCNKRQIIPYLEFYVNRHKCLYDILCWHKTNALPTYANKYLTDTEYILYFHKGGNLCHPQNWKDAQTYFVRPINHKDKKQYKHPTIKPLDILEPLIRNSTHIDDIILDPFMGSGSTGVASLINNRRFIGIEILEEYYEISRERLEECMQQ